MEAVLGVQIFCQSGIYRLPALLRKFKAHLSSDRSARETQIQDTQLGLTGIGSQGGLVLKTLKILGQQLHLSISQQTLYFLQPDPPLPFLTTFYFSFLYTEF